jgi:hypothetical protein
MCVSALTSLLSTSLGRQLPTCDCGGNPFCDERRRWLNRSCHDAVAHQLLQLHEPFTAVGCSLVRMVCRADDECHLALRHFERECTEMFTGEKCSAHCARRLHDLESHPKAMKLSWCICDDDGEPDEHTAMATCEEVQHNRKRLCILDSKSKRQNSIQSSAHRAAAPSTDSCLLTLIGATCTALMLVR